MCGIIGSKGRSISKEQVEKILTRGKDGFGVNSEHFDKFRTDLFPVEGLIHLRHSIVGNIPQPFDSRFVSNCEIYNWKELNKRYNLDARNDSELLYLLLEGIGTDILDEIDGDFAFIWESSEGLIFGRDRMGVKPLCFDLNDSGIIIASEMKCLDNGQFAEPGVVYTYADILTKTIQEDFESIDGDVKEIILEAINKRVKGLDKVGILFSGGVDSTLLAKVCKDLGKEVHLYTAGFVDGGLQEAQDVVWARQAAKDLDIKLNLVNANFEETVLAIKEIIPIIESNDIIKVGVALPFHFCAKQAHLDGVKVLLSGIGAEECFAGYQRHLKVLEAGGDVNEECRKGFEQIWSRDLYRDDVITMYHSVELRVPFLDKDLVSVSLNIPAKKKINQDQKKIILREIALELGVPKSVCERKKLGAQYGSKFDRAIEKLAKKEGMKKQEWLSSLN